MYTIHTGLVLRRVWLLMGCLVILASFSLVTGAEQGFSGISAGTGCGPTGTSVSVPVMLSGISDPVGNIDVVIGYDPSFLTATSVVKGDLTSKALFDYNLEPGRVRIGIASKEGFKGSGTLATLIFKVTETSGTSPVRIEQVTANHAQTLRSIPLAQRDGSVIVLAGIRFVTEGGVQKVLVDPDQIGSEVQMEGSRIICSLCGLILTIQTSGLSTEQGVLQGVVQSVTVASAPVAADLSFGRVEGRFDFTLPTYPTEGYFSLTFSETIDPATSSALEQAAAQKGRTIALIAFLAHISQGYGKTGPATGHFTVPNSLIESMGGLENIWIGHVSEYVSPELLKAEIESGPDQEGRVTLRFESPGGLSIFGMASAKVKSIANPVEPGTTPAQPGPTALTLFGNMVISAATLATGNLLVGAVVIGMILTIAAVGVFYYARRRT